MATDGPILPASICAGAELPYGQRRPESTFAATTMETIFFPHPEAFVRVWGTAGKAKRFSFDVLSSLQALSHPTPAALQVASKTYRTVANPLSPRRSEKKKKEKASNFSNGEIPRGRSLCICFTRSSTRYSS